MKKHTQTQTKASVRQPSKQTPSRPATPGASCQEKAALADEQCKTLARAFTDPQHSRLVDAIDALKDHLELCQATPGAEQEAEAAARLIDAATDYTRGTPNIRRGLELLGEEPQRLPEDYPTYAFFLLEDQCEGLNSAEMLALYQRLLGLRGLIGKHPALAEESRALGAFCDAFVWLRSRLDEVAGMVNKRGARRDPRWFTEYPKFDKLPVGAGELLAELWAKMSGHEGGVSVGDALALEELISHNTALAEMTTRLQALRTAEYDLQRMTAAAKAA